MSLTTDAGDRTRATALEANQKTALSAGVDSSYATALMTPTQYDTSGMAQNFNRASDAALFASLRALPFRLLVCTCGTAPTAVGNTGALICVTDGSAGVFTVAASNGTDWVCLNSLVAISPT